MIGVELGAGLGLPSIVAAKLGFRMIATDGDTAVIDMLRENAAKNPPPKGGSLEVKELLWGPAALPSSLKLSEAPDLLLAADVVYAGARTDLTRQLIDTMLQLSGPGTLLLIGNVRRFPVKHPKGEGRFFDKLEPYFERAELPYNFLHKDFQKTGVGSCVIHMLRRRLPLKMPPPRGRPSSIEETELPVPLSDDKVAKKGKKRLREASPGGAEVTKAPMLKKKRKLSAAAPAPLVTAEVATLPSSKVALKKKKKKATT